MLVVRTVHPSDDVVDRTLRLSRADAVEVTPTALLCPSRTRRQAELRPVESEVKVLHARCTQARDSCLIHDVGHLHAVRLKDSVAPLVELVLCTLTREEETAHLPSKLVRWTVTSLYSPSPVKIKEVFVSVRTRTTPSQLVHRHDWVRVPALHNVSVKVWQIRHHHYVVQRYRQNPAGQNKQRDVVVPQVRLVHHDGNSRKRGREERKKICFHFVCNNESLAVFLTTSLRQMVDKKCVDFINDNFLLIIYDFIGGTLDEEKSPFSFLSCFFFFCDDLLVNTEAYAIRRLQ